MSPYGPKIARPAVQSSPCPESRIAPMSLLALSHVRKRFGGLWAVNGVSFSLPTGRVVGLIGPNGSGKTTLLNTINGVYAPDEGFIELDGSRVEGLPAHQLAGLGVARTFQAARVFSTLTVAENMLLPTLPRRNRAQDVEKRARDLLEIIGIGGMWDTPASELSGGQQKLLEFARAQVVGPRLLLMDEPFAGVHPEIVKTMTTRLKALRMEGLAIIVVSHEVPIVMGLADEVLCMSDGRLIAHGPPEVVEGDPGVLEAYLGTPAQRDGDNGDGV